MTQSPDEQFLNGCGVFGPWKLGITRSDRLLEERLINRPFAFVGRDETNTVWLDAPKVSPRHAYLQALPGGLLCVDLGSRYGTRWGDGVRPDGWVNSDSGVRIGPFVLKSLPPFPAARWDAPSTLAQINPFVEWPDEVHPAVIGDLSHPSKGTVRWRLRRTVSLIGRSPHCVISINNTRLSRFHCSLVHTPTGVWVIDLRSRSGTYLNGRRITCEQVQHGDEVQLGKATLRLWYVEPMAPINRTTVAVPSAPLWEEPVQTPSPAPEPASPPPPHVRETQLIIPGHSPGTGGAPAANITVPSVDADAPLMLAVMSQVRQMQQEMLEQFQQSLLTMAGVMTSMHREQMEVFRSELDELRQINDELRDLNDALRRPPASQPAPTPPAAAAPGANPKPAATTVPAGPTEPAVAPAPPPHQVPRLTPAAGLAEGDLHGWLNQRISDLNQERQSRWSRLIGKILGK
jgi:pSer/pThr/pTyr-binding forkhead associated (FHA) protein